MAQLPLTTPLIPQLKRLSVMVKLAILGAFALTVREAA